MGDCQALPSSWSALKDQCIAYEPPKITNNKEAFPHQERDETDIFQAGFRKISLPIQSLDGEHHHANNSNTKLSRPYQRSFSDPSAGLKRSKIRAQQYQLPLTEAMDSFSSTLMNSCVSPSQCHSKTPHLPPLHPRLGRSFSSPTPRTAKSVSQSSSCIGMAVESSRADNSPEFKRIRRMNDCVQEMKQLCKELSREVEDEATSKESNSELTKGSFDSPVVEESVSVEKTGECLAIHFNCPCSRGYQILLSGNDCYYKLM